MSTRSWRYSWGANLLVVIGLGQVFVAAFDARAVVLYTAPGSSDPSRNTTAPLATQGLDAWNLEATWGAFLATPIDANHFIAAKHVGNAASVITFQGNTYAVNTASYVDDPGSDLRIYTLANPADSFSSYAALYDNAVDGPELGKTLTVIGRGAQRGDAVYVGTDLKGWKWGSADQVQSWGQNVVSGFASYGSTSNALLYFNFDATVNKNEGGLSTGDSSGGVFILSNGQWKLAGVNYSVSGPWTTNPVTDSTGFNGDIFDAYGLYYKNSSSWVLDQNHESGASFASSISHRLSWMESLVTWTGGAGTWSTAPSGNWKHTIGGTIGHAAANYVDGDPVTFDDTATETNDTITVDISAADVSPAKVAFNNSSKDFIVTGAKGITGSAGVLKQGAGTVTISSVNTYTGTTTVQAGTLELGPSAQGPVLSGPGGANIQGGKIVLDYVGTAPDVLASLTASYRASPSWSIGQIRDTNASATGLMLGWKDDVTAQQVTVMATLPGDTNLDGAVTGDDLATLLTQYNQPGDWSGGDSDYDGSVTGADLSLLLSKYNQNIPVFAAGVVLGGASGVPEPSSQAMLAALAAAMGLGVAGRRRFAARALLRTFPVSILKEVAMKRFLILGVCIVMSSALTARASVMPFGTFTKGGESVAVDYTRTAQTGALAGLDLVILSVDSINGAGSSSINGMVSAGVGNPTFTGLNGSYMYICDPGAVYITNAFPANFTAPGSYVNFDSVSGAFAGTLKSGAPAYAATLGAVHGYSEWSAGVFTTGAGIGVGGTLAAIYVPNNGNFQLVGGLSLQDGNVLTGSGMTTSDIPEPTTLALLATGLVGLLAYAWRKRR